MKLNKRRSEYKLTHKEGLVLTHHKLEWLFIANSPNIPVNDNIETSWKNKIKKKKRIIHAKHKKIIESGQKGKHG